MFDEKKWMREGRIVTLPRRDVHRAQLLTNIAADNFLLKDLYTEKQVNEVLEKYYHDVAFLRRLMIEYKILRRTSDCRNYWMFENEL